MKTSCFDAVVNFSPAGREKPLDVSLFIQGEKISASFFFYEQIHKQKTASFACVYPRQPLLLKWKDKFEVHGSGKTPLMGVGRVLNPFSEIFSLG